MLSCILSDSLEFRSPTTTDIDRVYAEELAAICGLDIAEHAAGMFAAKADIGDLSATDVVLSDSKVFTVNGQQLRVSVHETTSAAQASTISCSLSWTSSTRRPRSLACRTTRATW